MKVSQLKALLAEAPDDLDVLISGGSDHSYFQVSVSQEAVREVGKLETRRGLLFLEWYGKQNASEGETPVQAFVIHHGPSR